MISLYYFIFSNQTVAIGKNFKVDGFAVNLLDGDHVYCVFFFKPIVLKPLLFVKACECVCINTAANRVC